MRSGRYTRVLSMAAMFVGATLGTFAADSSPSDISLGQRISAQLAIERVYHSHRTDTTRPLGSTATREVLAAKVQDYLTQSLALELYWQRPVKAEMLEREVERMVRQSKMPDRLAELLDALGRDPILIQECLARPILVRRLTASYFSSDERIHAASRLAAERIHRDLRLGILDPLIPHEYRMLTGGTPDPRRSDVELHAGEIGPLREERHGFVIEVAVTPGSSDAETKTARYTIPKRALDSWLDEFAANHVRASVASVATADLEGALTTLFAASAGDPTGCGTGVWRPLARTTPLARYGHGAIWTGSEVIVWGGAPEYFSFGERYDPATDTWTATSSAAAVGAPAGREGQSVIWTGTEMITWGGLFYEEGRPVYLREGGAYDPLTDTWRRIATLDAPTARYEHTAVWTGTEMIVWGGVEPPYTSLDTGGRYSPATDTWLPLSTTNAPSARHFHTAVWSGTEMIVWGGTHFEGAYYPTATGGRYDPQTDTWTSTQMLSAPSPRYQHTAVWTGGEMIVWGASGSTGGVYDPASNTWAATTVVGAPTPRRSHGAVWTGTEMIVLGGGVPTESGGGYNPTTRRWREIPVTNAPDARTANSLVWTGTEMIVWGGSTDDDSVPPLNSGGRYDPLSNSWIATSATASGAPPSSGSYYTRDAVWTGAEMLVWNGQGESGRYDPVSDSWSPISTIAEPTPRRAPAVVWSGTEMIVWGGESNINTGGRYDPITDTWAATSTLNAPVMARGVPAIWAGTEMIVWGSNFWEEHGTGGRYDPATDTWTATSTIDAPMGATGIERALVWTGTEMIVWGGVNNLVENGFIGTGARYTPSTDQWAAMSDVDAPTKRYYHTAVWTGTEMIVWGGAHPHDPDLPDHDKTDGARYDPVTDTWTTMSIADAPLPTRWGTAVWTGSEMIAWGGEDWTYLPPATVAHGADLNTGGHYDPQTDTWWRTSTIDAPTGRWGHSASGTGTEMIVWGGCCGLTTGGLYGASSDLDEDGYCSPADCDEADPAVHNGAPEINDGIDNQCLGDLGFGAVDEISGDLTCMGDGWISWEPQEGATLYQVARSDLPDFSTDCVTETTTETTYDTRQNPDSGACWHYLVRALTPNEGSWGLTSQGRERTVACD